MPQPSGARLQDLDGAAAGGDDARARLDLGAREDLLIETDRLKDPQDFVVDHRGTRKRVRLVARLDRQRAHPAVPEQQRQELPDRPEPADDEVVVGHR